MMSLIVNVLLEFGSKVLCNSAKHFVVECGQLRGELHDASLL